MFTKGTRIHLVGIKGVGMTALAAVLKKRGCLVTGSDVATTFFTDQVLARLKIPVAKGFNAAHIPADAHVVISSVAYFFKGKPVSDHPEVSSALRRKLIVMTYPQAIGQLAPEYKVIAVAGSHGKSTTTALLGWILARSGLDPTVMVGTKVNKWESNARTGSSDLLIVEADEYREAFLNYQPYGAIITSVDYDHPDYFKTRASYIGVFKRLIDNIDEKGWLVACGGDPIMRKLITYAKKQRLRTISYGFSKSNDVQVSDWGIVKQSQLFHIVFHGKQFKHSQEWRASIPFPGQQYILNAGAAFIAAVRLGAEPKKALAAIKSFPGTERRLQVLKKTPGVVIDDYAHHPTAIRVTLNGIRRMYPNKKLIVVFQPHMYSRTAVLLDAFARSFSDADAVGITEIFASARESSGPVSGKDLAVRTRKYHNNTVYLPNVSAGKQFVKRFTKPSNVVVLMGAGDVYKLAS